MKSLDRLHKNMKKSGKKIYDLWQEHSYAGLAIDLALKKPKSPITSGWIVKIQMKAIRMFNHTNNLTTIVVYIISIKMLYLSNILNV